MAQNPMFNEAAFENAKSNQRGNTAPVQGYDLRADEQDLRAFSAHNTMTLQGTINKTFFLLFLCVAGGYFGWVHQAQVFSFWWLLLLVGFGAALWSRFQPAASPFLAPIYAICEGLLLGFISFSYAADYNGIVLQALGLTGLTFFFMLFIYKTGIIKVTNSFMVAVSSATVAIAIFYLASLVWMLMGHQAAYLNSSSWLSIAISIFICGVAALNLLLDFEFITRMVSRGNTPKCMEWYSGLGLLVTLVWLYLEILRLLAKSKRR